MRPTIPRGLLVHLRPGNRAGDTLITHADRCWKSEEANATRLASQTRVLSATSTALVAVISAGALRVAEAGGPQVPLAIARASMPIFAIICLAAGIALLFVSIYLLHPGQRRIAKAEKNARQIAMTGMPHFKRSASFGLELSEFAIEAAGRCLDRVQFKIFEKTYLAYIELRNRNTLRTTGIRRARNCMLAALLLTVTVAAVYVIGAAWSRFAEFAAESPNWTFWTSLPRIIYQEALRWLGA